MHDLTSLASLTESVQIRLDEVWDDPFQSTGTSIKRVAQTPRLTASCISVTQSARLPRGAVRADRFFVVLAGEAAIAGEAEICKLEKGTLLHVPSGCDSEVLIELSSPELRFLTLEVPPGCGGEPLRQYGRWVDDHLLVVRPEDSPAYRPANHVDTVNRCLFINDAIEIVRGQIAIGGGSEMHAHDDLEQITYVMEPRPELFIYTPPGASHGGGGYDVALDLIVIYSPPYRECLKYI